MKKTLVITDVTQMPTDRNRGNEVCVVGIDDEGRSVRPVCEGGFLKDYLYDIRQKVVVRHGAKVEFDLFPIAIKPPHIEDVGFKPMSVISKGLCSSTHWESVLQKSAFSSVSEIYGGFLMESGWVKPGAQIRSIATLSMASIVDIELTGRSFKPRITFVDRSECRFNLPVSDLTLWDYAYSLVKKQGCTPEEVKDELVSQLKGANRLYLRIGLARPWVRDKDEGARCWLQITGVYTFPDYLHGKSFADF